MNILEGEKEREERIAIFRSNIDVTKSLKTENNANKNNALGANKVERSCRLAIAPNIFEYYPSCVFVIPDRL